MTTIQNQKTIFFTCQGTRGDVQPYCNLGVAMKEQGWRVIIGAPSEFQNFVVAHHALEFLDIGPAPSHAQYSQSVSNTNTNQTSGLGRAIAAYNAAKELYNPSNKPPFTYPWFQRIAQGIEMYEPDILVLVFTSWCGAAVLPDLLGKESRTRVYLSYPMPMGPTASFCVSMAGCGHSFRWQWLNKLQWKISERMIVQKIHLKAAQRNLKMLCEEYEAHGRPLPGANKVTLDLSINTNKLPALFAFSPALVPKPFDWPENYHVIGQLAKKKSASAPHTPLPSILQEYLNECRRTNYHVVYIGFGSLGFFPPERVSKILEMSAEAIRIASQIHPVRGVIQTTLSSTPGKTGSLQKKDDDPFITFSESVDHAALFPQVSLVISHGGIGTVSTALSSGTPVLSMCCLPTADQSFWADVCYKKKLGPRWFWVDELKPPKMADGINDALTNFDVYTQNVEQIAKEMAKDDAITTAMKIFLDSEVEKVGSEHGNV